MRDVALYFLGALGLNNSVNNTIALALRSPADARILFGAAFFTNIAPVRHDQLDSTRCHHCPLSLSVRDACFLLPISRLCCRRTHRAAQLNMTASRSKVPAIGSAQWILEERHQSNDLVAQELEDFGFSVRNELEWLNEHMTDIFDKDGQYVAQHAGTFEHH